jgi:hypothetical protein
MSIAKAGQLTCTGETGVFYVSVIVLSYVCLEIELQVAAAGFDP